MITRGLQIGRWKVEFFFAADSPDDEMVLDALYAIDADLDVMMRANRIMESGRLNRGFTYYNIDLRRAVVYIGPTSSGRQFQNTLVHEIRHLADGIAKSLGVSLDAEQPAYASGDTMMALADVVCRLGCDDYK